MSDDEREPSAVLLLPDDGEGDMRSVALPHRRCSLTTSCASSQSPPSPWPAFAGWITDSDSSNYGRFSSAVLLLPDEQEGHEETCLHASLALLLDYLCASFQPPPGPSPGFSLGYQTKIHLVMAAIRLQSSCKWTKHDHSSPFFLGNVACLHVNKLTVAPKPLAQPSL